MPSYVEWRSSRALLQRIAQIEENCRPNGRATSRVKGDIRKIVLDDNVDKLLGRGLLEGVDRYGKPLAPMAKSTYQNPKRGFGPVLCPHGLQSRFIKNFEAVWNWSAQGSELICRYKDMLSKDGKPFAQYHLMGAKKPGTKWVLPKRDVGGITPKGWAKINARFKQFCDDVMGRKG